MDFDEMFFTAVRQVPIMRKASSKDEGTKKCLLDLKKNINETKTFLQNVTKNQKTNKYFIKKLIFQTLTNGCVFCYYATHFLILNILKSHVSSYT